MKAHERRRILIGLMTAKFDGGNDPASEIVQIDSLAPSTNYLLYGLTNRMTQQLLPLANSWNTPPGLVNATGAHVQGYRPQERASHLAATSPCISFQVLATEERPLVNPCFVIKGWASPATVRLLIDGRPCPSGELFRQGITYNTKGQRLQVVWVELSREEIVNLQMSSGSRE